MKDLIESGNAFYIKDIDNNVFKAKCKIMFSPLSDNKVNSYYICGVEALGKTNVNMGNVFFDIYKNDKTFLSSIFVKEEFRGIGIGKRLLRIMEFMSNECGAKSIFGNFHATTDYASKFYTNNGYKLVGEVPSTKVVKDIDFSKKHDSFQVSPTIFAREENDKYIEDEYNI